MMMPFGRAEPRPASYNAKLAPLRRSAKAWPSAAAMCVKLTFSSCPVSAFVAGEKIGGSSRALSTRPRGGGSPPGGAPGRERGGGGERVDLWGGRIIKKKKT